MSEVHSTARDRLRRTRQRYTDGRRDLVDLLHSAARPVTIAELVEVGAEQSQSSLYRNLAILEQCGVVRRLVAIDETARYELDEDLTHHHHHLVCTDCGRIDDIRLPDKLEASLDQAAGSASESHGYKLAGHQLELVGLCPGCQ